MLAQATSYPVLDSMGTRLQVGDQVQFMYARPGGPTLHDAVGVVTAIEGPRITVSVGEASGSALRLCFDAQGWNRSAQAYQVRAYSWGGTLQFVRVLSGQQPAA